LETAEHHPLRPEPPALVVEARALTKVYGSDRSAFPVLVDVDFTVGFGEIVALSGPSGSGKSTLLNILGCLDRPTSGSYRLGGTDVSALNRDEQAWVRLRYIGFIFQSFHLLAHATALENVTLPLHYAGLPRRAAEQSGRELLKRVGLAGRTGHFPRHLSGGERQRVAIARALAGAPRLLLADEPTGALDSRTGHEIMRLLLELKDEHGASIVLVTHDAKVASHAHRRVELLDGRVNSRAGGPVGRA
jgi:ABC-type lipoprotein export system ATPase subunit